MALQLRSSDDVRRLFSALRDEPSAISDLTLAEVDALALQDAQSSLIDFNALSLSLLVALITGWVTIRAYERNKSVSWALAWASFGYLLPIPAIALSYYQDTARN